jgi:hypothetical protein
VTKVGGETELLFKDIVYTAPPPPLADNAQRPNSYSLIGGIKSTFTVLFL